MPVATGPAPEPLPESVLTVLPEIVPVVPAAKRMPVTVDVSPDPDRVLTRFDATFTVAPAAIEIPVHVDGVDNPLIVLPLTVSVPTPEEPPEIPTTGPPVPNDVNPVIEFGPNVCEAPPLFVPIEMPVIPTAPLRLEIVFPETVVLLPPPLNVFPVTVFVAPPPLAPSWSTQPAMLVAPVSVMFEKLLVCSVFVAPEADAGTVV